jgi:hypothetical protein
MRSTKPLRRSWLVALRRGLRAALAELVGRPPGLWERDSDDRLTLVNDDERRSPFSRPCPLLLRKRPHLNPEDVPVPQRETLWRLLVDSDAVAAGWFGVGGFPLHLIDVLGPINPPLC